MTVSDMGGYDQERVILSGMGLSHLPPGQVLLKVQSLNLSDNNLTRIPEQLAQASLLKSLDCSHNEIEFGSISKTSWNDNNKKMFELDDPTESIYTEDEICSVNRSVLTESVPLLDISCLTHLTQLNLSHNSIRELPEGLSSLPSLTILDLSHNLLTELPPYMASSLSLTVIHLAHNRLTQCPKWLDQLRRCHTISMSGNSLGSSLSSLPCRFGSSCRRLKYFQLENIQLKGFPDQLVDLLDLLHLKISNKRDVEGRKSYFGGSVSDRSGFNCVWSFPDSLATKLRSIVRLEAANVGLTDLPSNFGHLSSLKVLDLSDNNLSGLPSNFCQLSKLVVCRLSNNKLLNLPPNVDQMAGLKHLLLSHNLLTTLPTFSNQLETLDVYHNQVVDIPDLRRIFRLDLVCNQITLWPGYDAHQKHLREWDGVTDVEGFIVNVISFQGREKLTVNTVGVEEVFLIKSSAFLREEYKNSESASWDLLGSPSNSPTKDEDVVVEVDQEDDWDDLSRPYDTPPRLGYRYNLNKMDSEKWHGVEGIMQFCPSDQHATSLRTRKGCPIGLKTDNVDVGQFEDV